MDVRFGRLSLLLSVICAPSALCAAERMTPIREVSINEVRSCKPLGQVVGDSAMCSKTRAKKSALKQAAGLGATHIVWLEVKCVLMVGEKATARIFDCAQKDASLDDSFEDYLAANPELAAQTVNAANPPRVMTSLDLDADSADLERRGYVLAGYAGIEGGRVPLEAVRRKAVAAGAEIALVQSRSAGEDVEYQAITSYSRGGSSVGVRSGYVSGHVAGQSVGAGGFGTSVVTSPGNTETHMVPFSQRRFETQVLFWRKLKAGPLGLVLSLIPPDLRAQLSRNTGAYVIAVEDETPAFFANIISGDIVIGVNGREVRTPKELASVVESLGATPMKVRIIRNTTMYDVEVRR